MRIFVTGATGFIGSAIVPELINAGHQVIGLTRSDAGAQSLEAAGAEAHRGTLEDPASLRGGAAKSDGVIHCAFDHDFSRFVENCEKDRRAIEALGDALTGSDRPLVITSGTGMGNAAPGQPATEDHFNPDHPNPRKASELAGVSVAGRGVNVSVVRLPQVHDPVKQGLITPYVQIAREKGSVAYVGDGLNRFPAAHVLDVARLYRLAIEKHEAGSRYHAVAEEGVSVRDIAEVIGRGLKLPVVSLSPEEAPAHFGWLAPFMGFDMPASNAQTRQRLGWLPTGPSLIADLEQVRY
ncbi:nucleoside-diphosphate-sugar epimerase [Silvibacterium bohemicum]|uniref:Nucleoside-diphosphate-sugar epimerase n=1 Tax=Silvibacterium bohemicum TaxID=1577686 RepID=A0A841JUU0_9BACT|nr:SDR family oxidoreductase [Silvibacterium bohemicum]MBB6144237.1 nucleoside-diphosphate-sugar epimerase [Silvibacterium bohemicum]